MQFTQPIPYREAIERLGSRTVVAAGLDSQDWAFRVPTELRDRAFFSSRIESARFLQDTKTLLGDWLAGARETITLPNGETTTRLTVASRAEFVQEARRFAVANGLGPLDPRDAGTIKDITSQKRLNLIYDIQTQAAHDYGYWKQGLDPAVLNEFPAARFIREREVKQKRIIHAQNEGVVRLKSDVDYWVAMNSPSFGGFGVPYGPWGFSSGMGVEDVDRDEAERLGLLQPGEAVESPEARWNERLRASTTNLEPDVQAFLKSELGDQVEIRDGQARWRTDPEPPSTPPAPATPAPAPRRRPRTRPAPTPTAPPAPSPSPSAPSVAPSGGPGGGPRVSTAMDLPARGKTARLARQALAAIDEIHSDGEIGQVPVMPLTAGDSLGVTRRSFDGRILGIGLRVKGPWPALTMIHEVGHVLDWVVFGGRRAFGSDGGPGSVLAEVMLAIRRSRAVARLGELRDAADSAIVRAHISDYLLSDRELWARAYAQFVARRTTDTAIRDQLAHRLRLTGAQQWEEADFVEIDAAIEAAFHALRWMIPPAAPTTTP